MRKHARGALANGVTVADALDEQDEVLARTTTNQPRRPKGHKKYARHTEDEIAMATDPGL